MRSLIKVALIACIGLGVAGTASAQQLKPEDTVKLRQGLMLATKLQFGALGAYAQGKGDLPADAAARVDNLQALVTMYGPGFVKGSEGFPGSEAKAGSFAQADFAKAAETYGAELTKLSAAAKSGNAEAIKVAAGAVGKACKGCHEVSKKD